MFDILSKLFESSVFWSYLLAAFLEAPRYLPLDASSPYTSNDDFLSTLIFSYEPYLPPLSCSYSPSKEVLWCLNLNILSLGWSIWISFFSSFPSTLWFKFPETWYRFSIFIRLAPVLEYRLLIFNLVFLELLACCEVPDLPAESAKVLWRRLGDCIWSRCFYLGREIVLKFLKCSPEVFCSLIFLNLSISFVVFLNLMFFKLNILGSPLIWVKIYSLVFSFSRNSW